MQCLDVMLFAALLPNKAMMVHSWQIFQAVMEIWKKKLRLAEEFCD